MHSGLLLKFKSKPEKQGTGNVAVVKTKLLWTFKRTDSKSLKVYPQKFFTLFFHR